MDANLIIPMTGDILQDFGIGRMGTDAGRRPMGGDAFSQLFLQLLGGSDDDDLGRIWEGLLLAPADGKKADDRKTGLLEILTSMINLNPGRFDFRQLPLIDTDEGIALDVGAVREAGMLTQDRVGEWLAALDSYAGRDTPAPADGEALNNEPLLTLIRDALPEPAGKEIPKDAAPRMRLLDLTRWKEDAPEPGGIPVKALGYENPGRSGPESEEALLGQEQFRQAVREARSKLSEKGNKTESNPAEILLGQSAFRATAAGLLTETAKSAQEPSIPEQIFLGLSQNLKAGKGEFVIKLVPEGLGEITVKLLAKEGRTTLRIITASAETARLINNDLASLQNALKPVRVEVREAIPETAADREANAYYAGFDQFEQFNQFNQFGNQGNANPSFGGPRGAGTPDEEDGPVAGLGRSPAPDSELDLYV